MKSDVIMLNQDDLPISCPNKKQNLYEAHPRVYLHFDPTKKEVITCPYCGTKYQLASELLELKE